MTTSATYAYCVVRSGRRPAAARAPRGLPGASRPELVPIGDSLWLVLARVPLSRYGPGALEPLLRDLDRVGRLALAHQDVVAYFTRLRGTTVVPLQLFTMFSTPERAVAETRRRRRALGRVIERVAGCDEWGVRVSRGERRPAKTAAAPSSGTAFLAARKRAREDVSTGWQAAAEAAEAAFVSLGRLARDRRRRGDAPAGSPPLLDAAFLVPSARRAQFRASARRFAREVARHGGVLTVTGPWPPYTFVRAGGRA